MFMTRNFLNPDELITVHPSEIARLLTMRLMLVLFLLFSAARAARTFIENEDDTCLQISLLHFLNGIASGARGKGHERKRRILITR